MCDQKEQRHQPLPPQQRVRRRTSSLSQHPPTGADWEACRHPSTLSPSGVLNVDPPVPVRSAKWAAHPNHQSRPLRSNLRRNVGWPLANLLGRDGFLAAALVSNPRGDALPQFWMLQRGVVVFLAISFNACLSQALRYEPPADELHSLGLWRVSTALFVLGAMAALGSVGYFAWVGIVFANVPKAQFPSFVAQNGPAFSAATYTHFLAFVAALLGTAARVWAEHPFWVPAAPWSSRLVGIAAMVGLVVFVYGAVALVNLFSATICNDNGFDGHMWPGLAESTNATLQRHQARVENEREEQQQHQEKEQEQEREDKVNPSKGGSASPSLTASAPAIVVNDTLEARQSQLLALERMGSAEVVAWLRTDERLAVLGHVARKECIDGSVLLEMVHMTAAEASTYYVTLFPSCPRGLGILLW
eukprot:CAMPEP_0181035420 /NCGR_PEP_ID=MMETSP1070-20121207/8312_1 /TAXON_ID=265543 /ORGANISM="Minutocellus polymorphus, Strain NH13" /LENGTH=416 /DNA_ID=CAMNT_0023112975 /DNA_START=64 /DNA_END=1311 /DNA_ORIENTATION=+